MFILKHNKRSSMVLEISTGFGSKIDNELDNVGEIQKS